MKRVYFLIMTIFFTSIVMSQEIWPRTFSGVKDALVHTYVDESNGTVYAIGSNGYDNNPVVSYEEPNLSNYFIGTTTGIGQCVIKFGANGNTIGYKKLGTENGVDVRAKVYMTQNNQLLALSGGRIYKINPNTGATLGTYPAGTTPSTVESMALVKNMDTNVQYLVVQTRNSISEREFTMTFTLHNITNFQILNTLTISFNDLEPYASHNKVTNKLLSWKNKFLLFGIHAEPTLGSSSGTITINYNGSSQNFSVNNAGRFYLFNISVNFGTLPTLTYNSELGNNDAYDFDVLGNLVYVVSPYRISSYFENFAPNPNQLLVPYANLSRYNVHDDGHYFFLENEKQIVKYSTVGNVEWTLDTSTFQPFYLDPTINYDLMAAGWYNIEANLPGGIMPNYFRNSGYNAGIGKIVENGNSAIFDRSVTKFTVNEIKVFPNPATRYIEFKADKNITGEIEIFDLHGTQEYDSKKVLPIDGLRLNVENFDQGTYFIYITGKQGVEKFTFIKH